MVQFAAFVLVALVAFQACSARHVLKASSPVVDSTYDDVFDVMNYASGEFIDDVYDASLAFTDFVRNVESAITFEDLDPEMYGDPEVAAEKALADIDDEVKSLAQTYSVIVDTANSKISDIVAQASAGVQDASVTALLTLIQQKYSDALVAIIGVANDFSDNAADVARDAIENRPDLDSVGTMEELRNLYRMAAKSIDRKINKASEQIDDAIAKA